MGREEYSNIAFIILDTDDFMKRIFFEIGDFNLEEYIIYSFSNEQYLRNDEIIEGDKNE